MPVPWYLSKYDLYIILIRFPLDLFLPSFSHHIPPQKMFHVLRPNSDRIRVDSSSSEATALVVHGIDVGTGSQEPLHGDVMALPRREMHWRPTSGTRREDALGKRILLCCKARKLVKERFSCCAANLSEMLKSRNLLIANILPKLLLQQTETHVWVVMTIITVFLCVSRSLA